MSTPNSRVHLTTFATSVRVSVRNVFLGLNCVTEPLESDLATQVEYDMDEQGAPTPFLLRKLKLTA